jgi:hypothetical protein
VTWLTDDLLKKAVECDRLIDLEADPTIKAVLRLIGELWVSLANVSASMSAEELAREVAAVEKIQSAFSSAKQTEH